MSMPEILCLYLQLTKRIIKRFNIFNPNPRKGGGGVKSNPPSISFILNNFIYKNRIDLKILDFLSYTYTYHIQLKKIQNNYYSSVDNHPKFAEIIGKNG